VVERLFRTEFLKKKSSEILCVNVVLLRVLLKFLFSQNRVAYSRKSAVFVRKLIHTDVTIYTGCPILNDPAQYLEN